MSKYMSIHSINELKGLLGLNVIHFMAKEDSSYLEDASLMKDRRIRLVTHEDNKLLLGGYILIEEREKVTKEGIHEGVTYTEYMLSIPKAENIPVVSY